MSSQSNGPSRRALLAGVGLAGLTARTALSAAVTGKVSGRGQAAGCSGSLPVNELNAVFGVDGMLESGGVLHFDFDRTDQSWTIFGIPVDADWGFDSEITFQPLCDNKALVKYEFCLLDKEVGPVWNALITENVLQPNLTRVNAIHNHYTLISPEQKFLHGTAIGDPVNIAKALYDTLKHHSSQPFESSPPQNTGLPNDEIAKIIGGMPMVSSKVLTVEVERNDSYKELGVPLEPASQLVMMFHFQKIGNDQAVVGTEFVLRPDEVDIVAETVACKGFVLQAVHNHELFIDPRLFYVHTAGTGDPITLAHAIHDALNHTNAKFQS